MCACGWLRMHGWGLTWTRGRVGQIAVLKKPLEERMLRRVREVDPVPPAPQVRCEVVLPCNLTPSQAEAYRTTLVRCYQTLTDPKPPRHAGHHAGQIRGICTNLCKVCRGFAPSKAG